ncbi:MAG: hypothetical protein HYV32_00945 [Candidatus Kerfeldbacteria bacterium]|nr:hypothetical protein [Candidatus Kerfeldbacteria bacterium]
MNNIATLYHRYHIDMALPLVLCMAIILLLGIPLAQQLVLDNQELRTHQQREYMAEQVQEGAQQQQAEYAQIDDTSMLSHSLVTQDHIIEFIESLENTATAYTVTEQMELFHDKQSIKNGIVIIPATITARGSWENLMRFFGRIEEFDFYINPRSINISEDSITHTTQMTIDTLTYWEQL